MREASRGVAVVGAVALAMIGAVHCVADEPATGSGSVDASTDGNASDVANPADGSNPIDAGPDAAIDPCKGLSNCPGHVNASHLQLWLRGDVVDCAGGRVVRWTDLSGHHRDAVVQAFPDGGNALSPACGSKINGHGVLTFDAPSASAPFFDGTLTVDLSFMGGSAFSVYVVHKPSVVADDQGLLAADHTSAVILSQTCLDPTAADQENDGNLEFVLNGGPGATTDYTYDKSARCPAFSTTDLFTPLDAPAWVERLAFDPATGHQIVDNQSVVLQGDGGAGDVKPLDSTNLQIAAIGRRSNGAGDYRYHGAIAEILVYDVADNGSGNASLTSYFETYWGAP